MYVWDCVTSVAVQCQLLPMEVLYSYMPVAVE